MRTRKHAFAFVAAALVIARFAVGCGDDDVSPTPAAVPDASSDAPPSAPPDASGFDANFRDGPPVQLSGPVDRMAWPLVHHLLVEQLDAFNQASAASDLAAFYPEFQRRLIYWDLLDKSNDWGATPGGQVVPNPPPEDAGDAGGDAGTHIEYDHPLLFPTVYDLLFVAINKPFVPDGFLGVEAQANFGIPNEGCAGRWLEDDVADKMLSLLITAAPFGVSDGVHQATKAPSLTFPYLAAPND